VFHQKAGRDRDLRGKSPRGRGNPIGGKSAERPKKTATEKEPGS